MDEDTVEGENPSQEEALETKQVKEVRIWKKEKNGCM
jgi:hypothetical protein